MTNMTYSDFKNVRPMKLADLKDGEELYYIHAALDEVRSGKLLCTYPESDVLTITDTNGMDYIQLKVDCVFRFQEDAKSVLYKRHYETVQSYKDQIKSVEDLVRFMYSHQVSLDEYTDYQARLAASIRAKELLGIEL